MRFCSKRKMRTDFLDRRTGFAGFTGGLGEWLGYEDGRLVPLEGQRPRLTHFSTTAVRNRFQTALLPKPFEPPVAHAPDKMILLSMILPSPCRIFTKSSHFTLLRLIALKFAVDLAGGSCQKHFKTLRYV